MEQRSANWCRQCGRYAREGHERQARFRVFHATSTSWAEAIARIPAPAA